MLTWKNDAFDTELLGVPSFKMWMEPGTSSTDFAAALDQAGSGFVACFTPHDRVNLDLLQAQQFRLISVRATLQRSVNGLVEPTATPPTCWVVERRATAQHISPEVVRTFAEVIGATSRYFKDPMIPASRSLHLYETWITNSLRTDLADEFLLGTIDGEPAAMHTVKVKGDTGIVDLIGVRPQFQRLGLGPAVLWAGLEHLRDRGVSTIEVVTEAENVGAVRMYERCGFLLEQTEFVFHRHSATSHSATSHSQTSHSQTSHNATLTTTSLGA